MEPNRMWLDIVQLSEEGVVEFGQGIFLFMSSALKHVQCNKVEMSGKVATCNKTSRVVKISVATVTSSCSLEGRENVDLNKDLRGKSPIVRWTSLLHFNIIFSERPFRHILLVRSLLLWNWNESHETAYGKRYQSNNNTESPLRTIQWDSIHKDSSKINEQSLNSNSEYQNSPEDGWR